MNRLITVGKAVKDLIDKVTADWGATFRDPIKAELARVANHRLVVGNVAVALDEVAEKRVVDLVHVGSDLVLGVAAGTITDAQLREMVLLGLLGPVSDAGALKVANLLGRTLEPYVVITPAGSGSMRWRVLPGVTPIGTGHDEMVEALAAVDKLMLAAPPVVRAGRVAVRRPR